MYFKIFKNDMKKNPGSNLAIGLFMALSSGLAALVFLMGIQLFTTISNMYKIADPPHFLQMHKGELAQSKIDEFNKAYEGVTDWQTVEMIDVYGDELTVEGEAGSFSMSDSRMDIGLVKQNERHDYLLDKNHNIIKLQSGEIGIPVTLLDKYPIAIGDTVTLHNGKISKSFVVAEFVCDGQMNSTLCSSTRVLLSDEDFEILRGKVGETEYIIETYFEDTAMAAAYQAAYEEEAAEMPKNGQAVTYTMIFLLSAMTDIMMAMMLFVISMLLIVIAFFCIRYTLLTAMEDELREIGTMKAMGVPHKEIRNLYLGKMVILLGIGTVAGYLLALVGAEFAIDHMTRTFGEEPLSQWTLVVAVMAAGLVYLLALQYCKKVLKYAKKVKVVEVLVTGAGLKKSKYTFVYGVMLVAAFMVLLPVNLVHTMESKEFITYMGTSIHDVMIEVEQGEELEERAERVITLLKQEKVTYHAMKRVRVETEVLEENGIGEFIKRKRSIHIDTGADAGKGIQYLSGVAPSSTKEIALSKLEAEQLGKTAGDSLMVNWLGHQKTLTVCGIYQDVTSGGMTAKAVCDFEDISPEQYAFMVDVPEEKMQGGCVEEWRKELGNGFTVEWMEEFLNQTLGGVTKQMKLVELAAIVAVMGLVIIIVLLFLKLRLAKEASQIAIKKAIGLSCRQIRLQELIRLVIAAAMGVESGTILVNCFGDVPVSILFQMTGLGIQQIQFFIQPLISWVALPLLLLSVTVGSGWLGSRRVNRITVVDYLNE